MDQSNSSRNLPSNNLSVGVGPGGLSSIASPSIIPNQPVDNSRRSRFRRRAAQACETCRARKTRCDQKLPCSYCDDHALQCYYRKPAVTYGQPTRKRRRSNNDPEISTAEGAQTQRAYVFEQSRGLNRQNGFLSLRNEAGAKEGQSVPVIFPSETSQIHTKHGETSTIPDAPETEEQDYYSPGPSREDTLREVDGEGEAIALGGVNSHTNGTEFYGGSSNLAFLGKLFSRARKRARFSYNKQGSEAPDFENRQTSSLHLSNHRLSIVNLMYNTDPLELRSGQLTPKDSERATETNGFQQPKERFMTKFRGSQSGVLHSENNQSPNDCSSFIGTSTMDENRLNSDIHSMNIQQQVEKIFIQTYFANKQYIHPFLCEDAFRRHCAKYIWSDNGSRKSMGSKSRFLALYYAVVAVGAINARMDDTSQLSMFYKHAEFLGRNKAFTERSTLEWANHYFQLAKKALGDIFETSSLETCQALFLMTVFCQNALKPHACYMYSGTAVRTAIAIGLCNEGSHVSISRKKEARRTWWSIYSHEVEMCCSSGRLDALKDPYHYSIPIPKWTKTLDMSHDTDMENPDVAIIPVMVELSQILKRASQEIYHDSTNLSMREKSRISFDLESSLSTWKNNLPDFLNVDRAGLNDSEWAFKQKLVLRMRLYNARIVIHRPFLMAWSGGYDGSDFSRHVDICLDASRKTVQMIYDAFTNRIYLRTWWYCTTYTIYASMIILHLILQEFPKVPAEELIGDVEKSLEIFSAMESVIVARRCSELTREMLCVAKKYLHDRNQQRQGEVSVGDRTGTAPDKPMLSPNDSLPGGLNGGDDVLMEPDIWNSDFLAALLSQECPNPTRTNALANLLDPSILEDFAAGGTATEYAQTVTSTETRDPMDPTLGRGEGQGMDGARVISPEENTFRGVLPQQFNYGLFDSGFR